MIGVFDSGYGGLTILKGLLNELPQYDYLYLGDNARAPYGNKSKEMVTHYTDQAITYLFERGAQLVIVACYTASALALRELQEKYLRNPNSKYKDRKILGVVRPVAEFGAKASKTGNIGVIATRGTVNSGAFKTELDAQREGITLTQYAAPLLVPLIEEGWHTKPEARRILKKYLMPLKTHNIDTLILGCTHYPHMKKDIERMMGKGVQVIDPSNVVADSLKDYLGRHAEIESQLSKKGGREFLTTDDASRFEEFIQKFTGLSAKKVTRVEL